MRFIKQHRTRSLTLIGAIVLATITVRLALQPADGATHAAGDTAIPVVTTTVAQKDVATYRVGIGTVQSAQSVTVKVRVDGQLDKVLFTEGQDVKQGELLAQIDPRPYQAQLNVALAQKAHDQATLIAATKDLERYAKLVAEGSIPQQTLDAQQATVDQLKASLQSDQAQIDNAQVQLSYTTIRAPVSGRTGIRLIDAGNIVHAADTTGLVIINQIDPITVIFTLPESDFQAVNQAIQEAIQKNAKAQLPVTASARDNGAAIGAGHLLLVNNQIDTSTGTFQLKAVFPNPKHTLWPGQYVNASLQIGIHHNALTIPEAAVQRGPNGTFVYVVKADTSVTAQPVHAAPSQNGEAIIDTGLVVGERVVTDGQFKIQPGTKVTEVSKAESASSDKSAHP